MSSPGGDDDLLSAEYNTTLHTVVEKCSFGLSSALARLDSIEGMSPHVESFSAPLEYIRTLKASWDMEKTRLPYEWMFSEAQLEQPIESILEEQRPFLSQLMIGLSLLPVRHMLSPLTDEEVLSRYEDPMDLRPDFLLSTARTFLESHWTFTHRRHQLFGYLNRTTRYASGQLHSLLMFNQDGAFADDVLMSVLAGSPSCWLLRKPQMCFPEELMPTGPMDSIRFCMVRQRMTALMAASQRLDLHIPVSFSNPALVIGAFDASGGAVSSETIRNVFHMARSSLASLVLASLYRKRVAPYRDGLGGPSSNSLPHFMMTFGIIWQSRRVTILAFIPFWDEASGQYRVTYCEVDTFTFGEYPPAEEQTEELMTGPNSPYLERIRLFLALKIISKHAFRLCDIFDAPMYWPPLDVLDMEQKWDLLHLPEDERTEALDDISLVDIQEAEAYAQEEEMEAQDCEEERLARGGPDWDEISDMSRNESSNARSTNTVCVEAWLGIRSADEVAMV